MKIGIRKLKSSGPIILHKAGQFVSHFCFHNVVATPAKTAENREQWANRLIILATDHFSLNFPVINKFLTKSVEINRLVVRFLHSILRFGAF